MDAQSTPLMQCGHHANARTPDGQPYCAKCLGVDDGATEPCRSVIGIVMGLASELPEADTDEVLIRALQGTPS